MVEQETVTSWLQDADIEWSEVPLEDDNAEQFSWAVRFTGGAGIRTIAAHRAVKHHHLFVQVALNIAETHRDLMKGLPEDVRDAFMYDLRIEMARSPCGSNIISVEDDPVPMGIMLGYNLYEDPLQRGGFFRRVHQLQNTGKLVMLMFQKLERFEQWGVK